MNVSVMVEQLDNDAYRATAFAPAPLVAEASTREQAVDKIRTMIRHRLAEVEVIQVEIPGPSVPRDPWTSIVCSWQGHPDAAEFEQNVKDYRQEVDRDPQRL
jgi:hypothetical protein